MLEKIIHKIKHLFISKKKYFLAFLTGLLLSLLLFLLFRTCTSNNNEFIIYKIGQDPQWESMDLMGKEKNMTAFTAELFNRIAQDQKIGFSFFFAQPNELRETLDDGIIDGAITSTLPTPKLQKKYLFSEPFFLSGPVLIVSKDSPINDWKKIQKQVIGILSSAPPIFEIQSEQNNFQLKGYDNALRALNDLKEFKIDGVILPALEAYTYTSTFYPDELKVATVPLTSEGLRLLTLNNQKGKIIIERFNEGLDRLEKDGSYEAIIEHWGLIDPEVLPPP